MDTAADWIDTGEHDEACPHCAGDGCEHCGGRGLVNAADEVAATVAFNQLVNDGARIAGEALASTAAPIEDAPITADPERLVSYLVRLAVQAHDRLAHDVGMDGGPPLYRAQLELRLLERMAQAAQVIVAELEESRSLAASLGALAGEVTARQLAAWAAAQDVDGRPVIHQWRDARGWHVTLSVVPPGSRLPRITEAIAQDPQDAITMLMAGRVSS